MGIIDLHCDLASSMYANKTKLAINDHHVALDKMKDAGYLAQWFAFFLHLGKRTQEELFQEFKEMYAYFLQEVEENKEAISIVRNYAAYKSCKESGKIAAFLSLEEGQVVAHLQEPIQFLEQMGITMMTLTWNYDNDFGSPHSKIQGLTEKGRSVLEQLNKSPILLDVSHLSEGAFKDIEELYKKPIIASHTNARGFYNCTRNLSDKGLRQIAESGGLIGTNFYSYFLENSHYTSVKALVNHMQYLYNQVGEEVLALGTDFDGIDCNLEVCNCREMDKLITGMGGIFPDRIIEKICYGNAERIIRENL